MVRTTWTRAARRHRLGWGLAGALTPLLAGCAAGIATRVTEPLHPSGPIVIGSLAVMPVTTVAGSEGFRPEVTSELVTAVRKTFPHLPIVEPDEAARRLASGGSAGEYADLVADYARVGVVEASRAEEVARALGVTHFLQVRAGYDSDDVLRPDVFGSHATHVEGRQEIVAVARLWSHDGGEPVWEAAGRTTSQAGEFSSRRHPFELVADLVRSLVARLPLTQPSRVHEEGE